MITLTTIKKNILFNYSGTAVNVIVPLLALPWYISLLGMKNWGLISFIWMLQSLLGILNAGIGQVLISKFAIFSQHEQARQKVADLFNGFEKLYWLVSISVAIVLIVFAEPIATIWLYPAGVSIEDGQKVIWAAALIFLLRFPVSVYQSVLFGLGYQGTQNIISAASTVIRHALVITLLFFSPDIETYLIWFTVSILLETVVIAYVSWRKVGVELFILGWKFDQVKEVLIISLGFSFAVIIGMLTLQVDKLVISWMLPIEQLGYYAIASAVGVGVIQAADPIKRAVLPTISQFREDPVRLRAFNIKVLLLVTMVIGVVGIVYMAAGERLLMFWLGDSMLVGVVMPVLTMLLCGSVMNTLYSVGHMNWVASGKSSRILMINISAFILALFLTPFMVENFGLIGATFPWIILNFIGFMLGFGWIKKVA